LEKTLRQKEIMIVLNIFLEQRISSKIEEKMGHKDVGL